MLIYKNRGFEDVRNMVLYNITKGGKIRDNKEFNKYRFDENGNEELIGNCISDGLFEYNGKNYVICNNFTIVLNNKFRWVWFEEILDVELKNKIIKFGKYIM